jgi:predicted HTH transcriptional regulator
MKENELKEIIKRGESDSVEFKKNLSSPRNLAILMASFANSYGGKILIGVTNKSKVHGIENVQKAINKINETANLITPLLKPEIEVVKIYEKNIVVVLIEPSSIAPHAVQGEFYKRKGHFSCLASINQLEEIITNRAQKSENSENILKEQIHQLLVQNSELTERFKKAQNWKNKLVDYIIGAAIGAAFSMAIQSIFNK